MDKVKFRICSNFEKIFLILGLSQKIAIVCIITARDGCSYIYVDKSVMKKDGAFETKQKPKEIYI